MKDMKEEKEDEWDPWIERYRAHLALEGLSRRTQQSRPWLLAKFLAWGRELGILSKANQLTAKGTDAKFASATYYYYDKNGSLTNLVEPTGATYFAYNAAGLVARMRWKDATATYFFYDGALRRYAMVANGTPTYFLWSGLNLLQELNADGTVLEEHTNAQTPIAGIAQLVETYRPAQAAALQKITPVMDMRGTITKWVESDGSTILASREYDAFGTIIPNSAVGTWPGRFGYQGQA